MFRCRCRPMTTSSCCRRVGGPSTVTGSGLTTVPTMPRRSTGIVASIRAWSQKGQWEMHYDPYDVSRIWVRNHHDDGWLAATWTHLRTGPVPFGDSVLAVRAFCAGPAVRTARLKPRLPLHPRGTYSHLSSTHRYQFCLSRSSLDRSSPR